MKKYVHHSYPFSNRVAYPDDRPFVDEVRELRLRRSQHRQLDEDVTDDLALIPLVSGSLKRSSDPPISSFVYVVQEEPSRPAPGLGSPLRHLTRCWSQIWVWRIICAILCLACVLVYVGRLTVLDARPITESSHMEPCPEEWTYFMKTCYYLNKSESSWTMSQDHCGSHNASLAFFATEKELNYLSKLCENDCWIGLHQKDGTLRWTNGTPYHNGVTILNNEECVYIKGKGILSTSDCMLPRTFICTMARKFPATVL